MVERRSRVGSHLVVLVVALLLWHSAGALMANEPVADEPAIDMTGHWASPMDASGIDIVQSDGRVRGTSLSGLEILGVISGRRVEFTFWRGRSYESADPEDRGTGVMAVTRNGQRAKVTWRNDKKKAPDEGTFVIVRVGPPDANVPQPAREDLLPLVEGADPGSSLSPEEEARLQDLYDQVLDQIDLLRYPGPPSLSNGSTPGSSAPPLSAPSPAPDSQPPEPAMSAPQQGDEAELKDVLNALVQGIDELKQALKDALPEGPP